MQVFPPIREQRVFRKVTPRHNHDLRGILPVHLRHGLIPCAVVLLTERVSVHIHGDLYRGVISANFPASHPLSAGSCRNTSRQTLSCRGSRRTRPLLSRLLPFLPPLQRFFTLPPCESSRRGNTSPISYCKYASDVCDGVKSSTHRQSPSRFTVHILSGINLKFRSE